MSSYITVVLENLETLVPNRQATTVNRMLKTRGTEVGNKIPIFFYGR